VLSSVNRYGMYHCCYNGPSITKCYRPCWFPMFIASSYQPLGYRLRRMTRTRLLWEELTARKLGYKLEAVHQWKQGRKGSTIFLGHMTCFSPFLATQSGNWISSHQSGVISWKLRCLTHFYAYMVLDYMCWAHYIKTSSISSLCFFTIVCTIRMDF
jgi:hypothetical protein